MPASRPKSLLVKLFHGLSWLQSCVSLRIPSDIVVILLRSLLFLQCHLTSQDVEHSPIQHVADATQTVLNDSADFQICAQKVPNPSGNFSIFPEQIPDLLRRLKVLVLRKCDISEDTQGLAQKLQEFLLWSGLPGLNFTNCTIAKEMPKSLIRFGDLLRSTLQSSTSAYSNGTHQEARRRHCQHPIA